MIPIKPVGAKVTPARTIDSAAGVAAQYLKPGALNLAALPPTGAYVLCGGSINRNGAGSTATIYGVLPPHH